MSPVADRLRAALERAEQPNDPRAQSTAGLRSGATPTDDGNYVSDPLEAALRRAVGCDPYVH